MDTTTREFVDIVSRERRRKSRREKLGKFIETFITETIAGSLLALIGGWNLMLAVGIAHHEWISPLPTIGYWWSVLLVWLLRGTFSRFKSSKEES